MRIKFLLVQVIFATASAAASAQTSPTPPTNGQSLKDQIESAELASESGIAKDLSEKTAAYKANAAALPEARRKEEEADRERQKKLDADFERKFAREKRSTQSLELDKVEVMQPGDLQLSCSALKTLAESTEQVALALDQRIGSDSQITNTVSTPCLVGGAGCALANQLVAIAQHGAAGDAQSLKEVRSSYQKRHDFLMAQIFAKRCK